VAESFEVMAAHVSLTLTDEESGATEVVPADVADSAEENTLLFERTSAEALDTTLWATAVETNREARRNTKAGLIVDVVSSSTHGK
jgi:hypothetical protein